MSRKEFYESWSKAEIKEWVEENGILVLFEPDLQTREARISIHGNLKASQSNALAEEISRHFGGNNMTRAICNKINEFADKWYSKVVLKRKARVINIGANGEVK